MNPGVMQVSLLNARVRPRTLGGMVVMAVVTAVAPVVAMVAMVARVVTVGVLLR